MQYSISIKTKVHIRIVSERAYMFKYVVSIIDDQFILSFYFNIIWYNQIIGIWWLVLLQKGKGEE